MARDQHVPDHHDDDFYAAVERAPRPSRSSGDHTRELEALRSLIADLDGQLRAERAAGQQRVAELRAALAAQRDIAARLAELVRAAAGPQSEGTRSGAGDSGAAAG